MMEAEINTMTFTHIARGPAEPITLGRKHKHLAGDVLTYFRRPKTPVPLPKLSTAALNTHGLHPRIPQYHPLQRPNTPQNRQTQTPKTP